MLTPLAMATIANAANAMYSAGSIDDRADERHADGRDRIGLLDLPRRDDGHDGEPEELLAGADPLAGPGVQVIVERAEAADEHERRQQREGRPRRAARRNRRADDDRR